MRYPVSWDPTPSAPPAGVPRPPPGASLSTMYPSPVTHTIGVAPLERYLRYSCMGSVASGWPPSAVTSQVSCM